jgi:rhamnose utilization protein RhaD (predicted bifunctional aldolase and dehydrogenase)
MSYSADLDALSQLSANLARNPLLVQAATGNTSIKLDGELWIKASGMWLADASEEEIFMPMNLAEIRRCIDQKVQPVAEYKNASGTSLQPSVETPMHAVMPHRVVIHVHAVSTIAWAVRRDGPTQLKRSLAGLSWQWIPYVSSGVPLALQIQRVMPSAPDVLILANHGLVIGAESCEAAEALLREVEGRFAATPRSAAEPQWSQLERFVSSESCWRLPENAAVHALATDAESRKIIREGILYPCQMVFLGPSAAFMPSRGCIADYEKRYQIYYGVPPTFFVVEDAGVLIRQSITLAQMQVLLGLAHVVQRISVEAPIRYLTTADLQKLSAADAHQYRYRVENRFQPAQTSRCT